MRHHVRTTRAVLRAGALALALVGEVHLVQGGGLSASLVPAAEAVIGRPLTPMSVAGVARRTARRAVILTGAYVATLPHGCATVSVNGAPLYQCGATYYQASGGQYAVVQVQ